MLFIINDLRICLRSAWEGSPGRSVAGCQLSVGRNALVRTKQERQEQIPCSARDDKHSDRDYCASRSLKCLRDDKSKKCGERTRAFGLAVLWRSLLLGNAGELAAQGALNFLGVSFAARHAADVGAVQVELTCNPAIKAA
jgi:hypothetical protein